jgi:hypothetical protein
LTFSGHSGKKHGGRSRTGASLPGTRHVGFASSGFLETESLKSARRHKRLQSNRESDDPLGSRRLVVSTPARSFVRSFLVPPTDFDLVRAPRGGALMSAHADRRACAPAPVRPVVVPPGTPVRGAASPFRASEPSWIARSVLGRRLRPRHVGRVDAMVFSQVLTLAPRQRQVPCKEA